MFPGMLGYKNLSVQFKITLHQIGNMSIDLTESKSKGNFEISNFDPKIMIIIIIMLQRVP